MARASVKYVVAVLAASLAGASGYGVASGVGPSRTPHAQDRPTLLQLEAEITSSSDAKVAPNLHFTVPPLLSLKEGDEGIVPARGQCASFTLPKNAVSECSWGATSSKHVAMLVGDSQARAWLPAFADLGADRGWRIVSFAVGSCTPWQNGSKSDYILWGSIRDSTCRNFIRQWVSIANELHPSVIVMSGHAGYVATNTEAAGPGVLSGMRSIVSRLAPSRSRVVLLSEVPQYYAGEVHFMTPDVCLTTFSRNVQSCMYSSGRLKDPGMTYALSRIAAVTKAKVADVSRLFCGPKKCALAVAQNDKWHLVYFDAYHINRFYAAWTSRALGQLLKTYFP